MKCRAAVPRGVGKDWEIQEITLDPPHEGEVLVKMAVAGICHTDDHFAAGDSVPSPEMAEMLRVSGIPVPNFFPLIGGHDGAGVVAEVGPGVRSVQPGDRVGLSWIPPCGRCRWCGRVADVGGAPRAYRSCAISARAWSPRRWSPMALCGVTSVTKT